jgi:hypothetical protein
VRGDEPELRVLSMPSPPMLFGLPGWLNTLKKSALTRTLTRSVIANILNRDASCPHWRTPGFHWFMKGLSTPVKSVVRTVVPSLSGIQTVLVSQ